MKMAYFNKGDTKMGGLTLYFPKLKGMKTKIFHKTFDYFKKLDCVNFGC